MTAALFTVVAAFYAMSPFAHTMSIERIPINKVAQWLDNQTCPLGNEYDASLIDEDPPEWCFLFANDDCIAAYWHGFAQGYACRNNRFCYEEHCEGGEFMVFGRTKEDKLRFYQGNVNDLWFLERGTWRGAPICETGDYDERPLHARIQDNDGIREWFQSGLRRWWERDDEDEGSSRRRVKRMRQSTMYLVEPDDVLTEQQVRDLDKRNYAQLSQDLRSAEDAVKWAATLGLIRNERTCVRSREAHPEGDRPSMATCKMQKHVDGMRWTCNKCSTKSYITHKGMEARRQSMSKSKRDGVKDRDLAKRRSLDAQRQAENTARQERQAYLASLKKDKENVPGSDDSDGSHDSDAGDDADTMAPCRLSLRKDSVFEMYKMSMSHILLAVYQWALDPVQTRESASNTVGISRNSLQRLYEHIRWFCQIYILEKDHHGNLMMGGDGKVVEIDESKVFAAKYHVGKQLKVQINRDWVFGLVERGTNKVYMEQVPRRNWETLYPIIAKHVLPGTKIMSDQWAAYNRLQDEGYDHGVVTHKYNFISPQDKSVHTQRVESEWRQLKRQLKNLATNKDSVFQGYLSSFMFRRAVTPAGETPDKWKIYTHLLAYIRQLYQRTWTD